MRLGLFTTPLNWQRLSIRQTRHLGPDRPLECDAQETVSPVCHSVSMDVYTEIGSTSMGQGADLATLTFADVVAGRNTSVFRPTPVEALPLIVDTTSQGQLQTAESVTTVPAKSRPIHLIRSGRHSQSLCRVSCPMRSRGLDGKRNLSTQLSFPLGQRRPRLPRPRLGCQSQIRAEPKMSSLTSIL